MPKSADGPDKSGDKNAPKRKKADRTPTNPTGWYVLVAVVLAVLAISVLPGRQAEVVTFTAFAKGLDQGRYDAKTVEDLVLGRTAVTFKYTPRAEGDEEKPTTSRIRVDWLGVTDEKQDALLASIEENRIPYKYAADQSQWQGVIYLGFFGLMLVGFALLMRRIVGAGAAMNFGRSRGKLAALEDVGVTFADVAGIDEAVDELKEIVEFLRTPEKYQALGGRIPRGVLLVGPPGTGKTLLAKAVAGEAGVPFFSLSGSDFVEMFVGVGAARVRDMFQQAQSKAPSIIFIDELDALGKTRGSGMPGGHDEREQTLNALLVEMDGFDSDKSVIVIGATNRPETLDPALLRPGRFDRNVTVDRPDKAGREKILKVHAKRVKLAEDVDLERVARITPGFVGADLANLANEAALLAARSDKKAAGQAEFEEGIERVVAGLEKSGRLIREDEKERVSYHECGHALVACALPMTDPVHKISIIPRGMGLGYTLHFPEDERMLTSQTELFNRICCLLGGMAAERIVYGENCTGVQNDLQRASDIARRMVTEFGMSEKLGKSYYSETRTTFLGPQAQGESVHAEETVREIDLEVRRLIDEAYATSDEILRTRRDVLDRLARELLEVEVMDAEHLQRIVDEYKTGPQIKPGTSSKAVDLESDTTAGTADDDRGRGGIEIG